MRLNVLGLSSGTSLDAIDVAICTITSSPSSPDLSLRIQSYTEIPWDPQLRAQILSYVKPGAGLTMADVCDLNFAIGEEFARAIRASKVNLDEVDLIVSHGQTVWHIPTGDRKSTLQLGEGSVIAAQTRKTVVSDVRVAELANGRQGAPLAGFFEAALLRSDTATRVSQNLGGIGNCTIIPPPGDYLAFDTGPANVLIDAAVRILSGGKEQYDKDGERGKRGEQFIDNEWIEEILARGEYYNRLPPKTTGRELFSDDLAKEYVKELQSRAARARGGGGVGSSEEGDGVIATLTRLTARSVVKAYQDFLVPTFGDIHEIYLCGGGAFNPNIANFIAASFPNAKVGKLDDLGVRADGKEAAMFATLGFLCIEGRSVRIMKGENGGRSVMGKISPGDNWREIMDKVDGARDELGKILLHTA